jgi:uncharacterized protein YlxW (UPF0749 family)
MKSIFYPFRKKKRKNYSSKKYSDSSRIWSLSKEVNSLREEYYILNDKIRELARASNMTWKEGFGPITDTSGKPTKTKPDFICK